MADDIREDADNEITRIVRRPGPAKLPINLAHPAPPPPAGAMASGPAPVIPGAADPAGIADETAFVPPMRGPAAEGRAANLNAIDGAPPVVPPVALDRPPTRDRPVMIPPPPRPPAPQGGAAPGIVPPPAAPRAATPLAPPTPGRPEPVIVRPTPVVPPAPVSPPVSAVVSPEPPPAPAPQPVAAAPAQAATLPIEPVVGWLVIVKGPGRGTAREIVTGRNGIGSASGQDILLDFGDPAIAPQGHAYIVYDDEAREFVVEDGKQKIVVRLNGKLLTETMPIGDGDELRIGATTLRFVALCGTDFDWGEETKPEAAMPADISVEAIVVVTEEG
jgi:hypothetical protein